MDTHNRNERVYDVNNRDTHQSGFTVKTPQYKQHHVIISLGQEAARAGLCTLVFAGRQPNALCLFILWLQLCLLCDLPVPSSLCSKGLL